MPKALGIDDGPAARSCMEILHLMPTAASPRVKVQARDLLYTKASLPKERCPDFFGCHVVRFPAPLQCRGHRPAVRRAQ